MKPSIPQGTRDYSADVVRKRHFIFNTIRNVFELYGFQPLETPAIENIETLMGKYGEEGDKLIFKILNNGLDNPAKLEKTKVGFEDIISGKASKYITERALRYDLTIPFARYVAMNFQQLPMPFKRYQMQPVWRADRPQKGRYREFYQCDADVVGSNSLLNEIDLINIYSTVFKKLNINIEIRINNRKVLAALADLCGGADKMMDITIAIDKLDKIGIDKVKEELANRGLGHPQITQIESFLTISGNNAEKIQQLKTIFGNNAIGQKGIEELEFIILHFSHMITAQVLTLDLTLARGLNYYTGTILEVKAKDVQIGSIGGGGRYDDLTGLFGVTNVPGVGISFGVDRIYDVMNELNLFPSEVASGTQVLFFNLGETEVQKAMELASQLRAKSIACEVYHENSKFDKQFKYAEKKSIPYVVILGSEELQHGVVTIKNLLSGDQKKISFEELLSWETMK